MTRLLPLALLVAACSTPDTLSPQPVRPDEPSTSRDPVTDGSTQDPSSSGTGGSETTGSDTSTERSTAASGVRVLAVTRAGALDPRTRIMLFLPVGEGNGRPAVATWSAEAFILTPIDNGPSLQSGIAALGGQVTATVGARTTAIEITVDADQVDAAVDHLANSLAQPGSSRTWIESARERLATRSLAGLRRNPAVETARHRLIGTSSGPAAFLQALQDRDATEILVFQRAHYQPAGAIVTLVGQDVEGKAESVAATLGVWGKSSMAAPSRARPDAETPRESWTAWSPSDADSATQAFVLPVAPIHDADTARLRCLLESVTMSGVGGRLEQAMLATQWRSSGQSEDQGLRAARLFVDGRPYLVLSTESSPTAVAPRMQVFADVVASIATTPLSPSERELAARRARLTVLSDSEGPRQQAWRAAYGLWLQNEATAEDVSRELDGAANWDLTASSTRFATQPTLAFALGGTPPEDNTIPVEPLLPTEVSSSAALGSAAQQVALANATLNDVRDALGGGPALLRFVTFTSKAKVTGADIPEAVESLEVSATLIQRTRRILGTTIETRVEGDEGMEKAGAMALPMEPERIQRLRDDIDRHPVRLLLNWSRKKQAFRHLGERSFEGTTMAILEATGPRFPRLRIHVDQRSNLPRILEYWDEQENGTTRYVRERWTDYRRIDGLRVPFRCEVSINDGAASFARTWSEVVLDS